jgi:fructose-specific phosphotransferase system IIC component
MDQLLDIVFSVPFVGIAVIIALLMFLFGKIGAKLWSLKKNWIRQIMRAIYPVVPVLPSIWGAALGAVPWWPVPEPFVNLHDNQKLWVMIILGLIAGSVWERVWKTFKQSLEARGIKIDLDEEPRQQSTRKG